MPTFTEFLSSFSNNIEVPTNTIERNKKRLMVISLSGVFLIGLVIYLVDKNKKRG